MEESTDNKPPPPFRFSLIRLIIVVNLIGLGAVPLLKTGVRWLSLVALFIFVCFLTSLRSTLDLERNVSRREAFKRGLRFAFWTTLFVYFFLAVYVYIYPDAYLL